MEQITDYMLSSAIDNSLQMSFFFLGAGLLGELQINKDLPISDCLRYNIKMATALSMSVNILKITKNIMDIAK